MNQTSLRFVEAPAGRIAYVDEGVGMPVVFVHGNPTSKYVWRNVLPPVASSARAVALDLPGMGDSDKPSPAPRFGEQCDAFEAFVEALGLGEIVVVGHDWGAAVGFDYARRNPARVRGIAFMEGVLPPAFPQPSFEAMGPDVGAMFRAFKDPDKGRELIVEQNFFIERVLPDNIMRKLTAAEMEAYRAPFVDPRAREMLLRWPREIPIAGEPEDVVRRMEAIEQFISATPIPLLLLHADPGVVVQTPSVDWYRRVCERLEIVHVGSGLHFLQEDQPEAIGYAIAAWIDRNGWGREA